MYVAMLQSEETDMNEHYIDAGGLPPAPPLMQRGGGGKPRGIINSLKTKTKNGNTSIKRELKLLHKNK
jgi:hypothetical protein